MSRLQNLNSLRVSNIDVAFATAFGTLTSGAFLVGYMKTLGASDIWVNLLAALPSLVGVLQIPGGILGRGVRSYKKFVAPGGLTWRILYIPFIILPLGMFGSQPKLLLLTLCVALASVASVFVGPVYNDWIAELVPESSRGFYFARRNAIAAIVGAVVGIFGAVMLDQFRAMHLELQGFTAVYVLGLVCAFISWIYFGKMGDLLREHPIKQTVRQGVKAIAVPFRDRAFRPVLVFLAIAIVGQTFAGNLFVAYARESLHLNYKIIQGTAVAMAIGNLASAPAWGFLTDKYGNKPLLVIAILGVSINPLAWMLCQPGREVMDAWILLTAHVYMGVMWCGVNLCQFNIMLKTAKPDDRANYIGAATTVMALVGGAAPLMGGFAMEAMRAFTPALVAYRWIFLVSGVMRLGSAVFLLPVREKGAIAVRETLRDLSALSIGGVRALRTLSRPGDIATRESAIDRVGADKMGLASDEIIKALHDPLPSVRRRAAMALSRLDDPRAVQELVHQIQDHPDLLDEEAVNALGAVGDLEAVAPLITLFDSPRPLLRRAAARALGMIGSRVGPCPELRKATDRLIHIAKDPNDPDLRRASLQALRFIGAHDGEEAIVDALLDQWPSVRVAAAEAVEELGIKSAAPNLRQSLTLFADEGCAESAYALAVAGDPSDIPLILHEAARSTSMITRRRCLLGVARLLNVEGDAYRLILMEDMARDAALQERLKPKFRGNPRLREAFSRYGAGDEALALELLATIYPEPAFQAFADQPVEELFLVAALAVGIRR